LAGLLEPSTLGLLPSEGPYPLIEHAVLVAIAVALTGLFKFPHYWRYRAICRKARLVERLARRGASTKDLTALLVGIEHSEQRELAGRVTALAEGRDRRSAATAAVRPPGAA
jgi:hypothetical protein